MVEEHDRNKEFIYVQERLKSWSWKVFSQQWKVRGYLETSECQPYQIT